MICEWNRFGNNEGCISDEIDTGAYLRRAFEERHLRSPFRHFCSSCPCRRRLSCSTWGTDRQDIELIDASRSEKAPGSALRGAGNMAIVNRSARGYSKHVFIVVILVVTVLFPLLALFNLPSEKPHPTPAVLPFQSSKFEAGGVGQVERLPLPGPVCECKCKLKTEREEEASAVIQTLETEERSKAFEKIFTTDFWGGGESRSGPGSRIDYTANVRKLIAHALKEYHVGHVLDAPCGGKLQTSNLAPPRALL